MIDDLKHIASRYMESYNESYVDEILKELNVIASAYNLRYAGTMGEHRVAEFIAREFERIGLLDVKLVKIPIKLWICNHVEFSIEEPLKKVFKIQPFIGCKSSSIYTRLQYAGRGRREDFDRINARGSIILIELDYNIFNDPLIPVYEAFSRGAEAVIVTNISGYAYEYQNAIYVNYLDDFEFPIPIAYIDAFSFNEITGLLKHCNEVYARLKIDAKVSSGYGYNVLGYIPSNNRDTIAISTHHDGLYTSAISTLSGIATLLSLACYLIERGYNADHTILLTSLTAREAPFLDGINSFFNYLEGKGRLSNLILYLDIDRVGYSNLAVYSTPDLSKYLMYLIRVITDLNPGVSISLLDEPEADTHIDIAIRYGISSISISTPLNSDYYTKYYHTNLDSIEIVSSESIKTSFVLVGTMLEYTDKITLIPYNLTMPITKMMHCLKYDILSSLDKLDILCDFSNLISNTSKLDYIASMLASGDLYIDDRRYRKISRSVRKIKSIILRNLYSKSLVIGFKKLVYKLCQIVDLLDSIELTSYLMSRNMHDKAFKELEKNILFKLVNYVSKDTYKYAISRILKYNTQISKSILVEDSTIDAIYEAFAFKKVDVTSKILSNILRNISNHIKRELVSLSEYIKVLSGLAEACVNDLIPCKYEEAEEA